MVTAAEVKALAARLAKAEALVAAGKVHAISGLEGYFAVASSTDDGMYLVHLKADGACCSCPDWAHHGKDADQGCKHIYAAQLAASAPQARPVEEPAASAPVAATGALALLRGDDDDFDPYPMQAA